MIFKRFSEGGAPDLKSFILDAFIYFVEINDQ